MNDLADKIGIRKAKIAIVGFGYIGTCFGVALAQKGYTVIGIDNDKKVISELNKGRTKINEVGFVQLVKDLVGKGRLSGNTDYSSIKNTDIILLTVGTPINQDLAPDFTQLKKACSSIKNYISDQLVIIKSTIPPLTTESLIKEMLFPGKSKEEILLAYCPERIAQGNALEELRHIPAIIGGINENSSKAASFFFKHALDLKTIKMANPRAAELTKLADNLWIDLNIAMASELALLADKLDLDVLEVIGAANSLSTKGKGKINILTPSIGVGGSCLTKDSWFLDNLAKSKQLSIYTPALARKINDNMPFYAANLITMELSKSGKDLSKSKVAVLGLAFKNNTGDCRFTPVKKVVEALLDKGCSIELFDPLVSETEASTVTHIPLSPSLETVLENADCVAFLAGHKFFRDYGLNKIINYLKPGTLVFDGRIFLTRKEIKLIKSAGLKYKGTGRV